MGRLIPAGTGWRATRHRDPGRGARGRDRAVWRRRNALVAERSWQHRPPKVDESCDSGRRGALAAEPGSRTEGIERQTVPSSRSGLRTRLANPIGPRWGAVQQAVDRALTPLSCGRISNPGRVRCGPSASCGESPRTVFQSPDSGLAPRWFRSLRRRGRVSGAWFLQSPARAFIAGRLPTRRKDGPSAAETVVDRDPMRGPDSAMRRSNSSCAQGRETRRRKRQVTRPRSVARSGAACARACVPRRRRSRTRLSASRPRATHQRQRGLGLHPRRRSQPPGALGRARARRPRQGSSGCPLSHRARHTRHAGSRRSPEEPVSVRGRSARSSGFEMRPAGS